MYRWKNPQYKFLLLLERQWPTCAQCKRRDFLFYSRGILYNIFFKTRFINVKKNWFGGQEAALRMKSHFAQRLKHWIQSVNSQISLFGSISLTCFFVSVSRPIEMAQTSLMHLLKGIYTWHTIFILLRDISDRVVTKVCSRTHRLQPCKSKKLHVFCVTDCVKAMQSEWIIEVEIIHQEIILLWVFNLGNTSSEFLPVGASTCCAVSVHQRNCVRYQDNVM